jgi:alpha-ketoglutaric semialdehyde dehydrogenase
VFVTEAGKALGQVAPCPMLTPGIQAAFEAGVNRLAAHASVKPAGRGAEGHAAHGRAALFETNAKTFTGNAALAEEVFGASSLVVRCADIAELRALLEGLEGQLTVAVHMTAEDYPLASQLLPILEEKAGRILVNGFGTGVEVSHAMVHGGPYPATSDPRSTSVGSMAIRRFLRPVCYQDFPDSLLPDSLKDANPFGITRLMDGKLETTGRT